MDTLDVVNQKRIQIICQPGNGGPVEDWINVEQFCYQTVGPTLNPNQKSTSDNRSDNNDSNNNKDGNPSSVVVATIIVNGALDKVRDGYYPPIFFPALAKTMPFYRNCCEPILFVKPISDKGYYGWMFRVYPEPWQIILQLPKRVVASSSSTTNDDKTVVVVEDIVVLVSETRPSYQEAVTAMVQEAQKRSLLSSSL